MDYSTYEVWIFDDERPYQIAHNVEKAFAIEIVEKLREYHLNADVVHVSREREHV